MSSPRRSPTSATDDQKVIIMTTLQSKKSKAIGPNDIISVHGQYLYKPDGSRFFMKGMAFPVPLKEVYNGTAWIGLLEQLHSYDLDYNTVRIYSMDPEIDYSEFFRAAAKFGVYVIVPLTSRAGDGVLGRNTPAPRCYKQKLYEYGISALRNYMRYSNVLAGLLANEVMNTEDTWTAAPCIKAYARDLKLYMHRRNWRPLPLIYAAQHSGIGSLGIDGTMWLTLNYLTCRSGDDNTRGRIAASREEEVASSIDIFGVNIESWCSSQSSFIRNEDGTAGSYYSLWLDLHQSTVPLVFTEMGCSHTLFDRDNGLHTPEGTRDWKQVHSVLHDMSDTWSGFCAYAYSGGLDFDIFEGGPWTSDSLEPTQDFWNFRDVLKDEIKLDYSSRDRPNDFERFFIPRCAQIEEELQSCCDINLYPVSKIPSYEQISFSKGRALEIRHRFGLKHLGPFHLHRFGLKHLGPFHFLLFMAAMLVLLSFMCKRLMTRRNSRYQQID